MSPDVVSQKDKSLCVPSNDPVRRWATVLMVIAVLLPGIISFGVLYSQPLSVPYQDDYKAILDFAINYKHLPNLQEKMVSIATVQYNEYKLGFEHAIVASELELDHHLNFGFLIALGDCFLLGIGYLLWKVYSSEEDTLFLRALRFLPISLIFFSLTYWENLNWALTGLVNTPVIFFTLFALYLLIPDQHALPGLLRMLAACFMAALAAFTSANAFLLGLIGLLFLLPRRAYGRSLMWCASFVVPCAAYLYHYSRHTIELGRFHYLKRPFSFLAFLGCAIPSRWLALLVGILILAIIILAIRARFDRIEPVAFYFAMWIVATALLVAYVRGAGGFAIASRYSIYSILLLIFCYSFLAQYLPSRISGFDRRRFYAVFLVFAFGIWLIADVRAYKLLKARRQMVVTGIELYRAAPSRNSPMIDPAVEKLFPEEKAYEPAILTKAIQEGIYTLPPKNKD